MATFLKIQRSWIEEGGLELQEAAVLSAIVYKAARRGIYDQGKAALAAEALCSLRTLCRALDRLEAGGWITRERVGHGVVITPTIKCANVALSEKNESATAAPIKCHDGTLKVPSWHFPPLYKNIIEGGEEACARTREPREKKRKKKEVKTTETETEILQKNGVEVSDAVVAQPDETETETDRKKLERLILEKWCDVYREKTGNEYQPDWPTLTTDRRELARKIRATVLGKGGNDDPEEIADAFAFFVKRGYETADRWLRDNWELRNVNRQYNTILNKINTTDGADNATIYDRAAAELAKLAGLDV